MTNATGPKIKQRRQLAPIPKGIYLVYYRGYSPMTTNRGHGFCQMRFEIADGVYKGRMLFQGVFYKPFYEVDRLYRIDVKIEVYRGVVWNKPCIITEWTSPLV